MNDYLTKLAIKNIIQARESEEAFQKAYANLRHQFEHKITRDIVITTLNDDLLACDTTLRLKYMLGLCKLPEPLAPAASTQISIDEFVSSFFASIVDNAHPVN